MYIIKSLVCIMVGEQMAIYTQGSAYWLLL